MEAHFTPTPPLLLDNTRLYFPHPTRHGSTSIVTDTPVYIYTDHGTAASIEIVSNSANIGKPQ